MGALVARIGTFGLFLTIMAWGLLVQGNSPGVFTVGATLTVAVVTSAFVAVPYVLGSLVARVAGRPWWIAGTCAAAALLGLSVRIYLHMAEGGIQAFINMVLHTIPYSVFTGWTASLWHSVFQAGGLAENQAPSMALTGTVTAAALLRAGGSAVGYMLRNSTLWFKVGVPMAFVSLGLSLWTLRRAGKERDQL